MGSCASVSRGSESAMKMKLSLAVPPSPVKEKQREQEQSNGDQLTVAELVLKSQWSPPRFVSSFRDEGSKEETFFDTKAWMDSDCEDDFYSVNGDFTPSRGNTPVHHKFSNGTPRISKALPEVVKAPGSISVPSPSPSPTEKKKKLLDLFREGTNDEQHGGDSNATPFTSTANSVCSSERVANEDPITERGESMRSSQGCLPSLMACGSFSERKKKMNLLPPAIAVNDKS